MTFGLHSIHGKIYQLTDCDRLLKPLPNNLLLEAHYTKIIKNKAKAVQSNDFELLKVIGKGGFSKVYMGNQLFYIYSAKKGHWLYLRDEGHEEGIDH